MDRPNVLFIITDQLRSDHTGFGGNSVVKTPNLDRLADESVRFRRAYCAHPLCGPSRRTLLTGRMPSVHGSWDNGTPLDWDANTFVRVLREHGYRTGHVGKSHIQEIFDRPPPNAGDDIPTVYPPEGEGKAINPTWGADWDQWELGSRHKKEWVEMPEDYYGFDSAEIICGHEDLPSGHYLHWAKQRAKQKGLDLDLIGGPQNALQRYDGWNQVYQSSVLEELYPTTYVTQRSIDFLEKSQDDDRPFFLFASYPDPHHPFTAPGRYYDMYDPDDVPLPDTFYDTHEASMPHIQAMIRERGKDHRGPFPFSIDEEQYRHASAVQYGLISMIDDGIGQILATLKQLGVDENTIVVFTSDHGDMFGDHGLMLKHAIHYQSVINIPLLIKAPGIEAGQTDSMASLLDIGRTILDLTNCPTYQGMQGHSLVPALHDTSVAVRDRVLIEEGMPLDVTRQGSAYCLRTLVTEEARLTIYEGFEHGELFDLQNDPDELNNLFAKPEGQPLRAKMMEKLVYTMMAYSNQGKVPPI